MKRKLFVVVAVIILLSIPASIMLASGELFPPEPEKYNVAFISDGTHQTIFVRNTIKGVYEAMCNEPTVNAELYLTSDSSTDGYIREIAKAVSNGADLIIASGYEMYLPMLYTSRIYPYTDFATIDGNLGEYPENFVNIIFRSNEPSFIAGYISGMMTQTGKIGFLGGIASDAVKEFYYGFKAGIDTAKLDRDINIELVSVYTDTFNDPDLGFMESVAMYADGVDILYTVAGDTGLGGIEAAKEMNKYVIGVDVDQNYLAPNNVIFSVVKELSATTENLILDYAEDNSYGGGVQTRGYAEGSVGVNNIISAVPEDLVNTAETIETLIINEKIDVPKTEEEYNAWKPVKMML